MKFASLFIIIFLLACGNQQDYQKTKWIQLFNGKDLTSWDIKISGYPLNENYKHTFIVEDGLLKINYSEYEKFNGEFGHIFYKRKFSHYKLRIEYRFVGQQVPGGPGWAFKNNGAMLHAQSAESMGLDQDFPVSIEAQFLGGDSVGDRPTANLCTPGTNVVHNGELLTQHCVNSSSKTFRGEEWVTVEMVVLGDSIIHHLVNGDTVLTYTKPQIDGNDIPENFPLAGGTLLKEGYIALQAESHPTEFRKVELLDLSDM
jgi:hypothetical protein